MSGRIVVERLGGPEVLKWTDGTVGEPGEGEIRVRHTAVGLNFVDVYFRTGLYAAPLPFVPGSEACGVVEALGAGVADLRVGDRVAYGSAPMGAYSESRLVPAARVVVVPDGVDDQTAAAMMLKGMTAEYLLRRTIEVKRGDAVLVHAAAGGVGLILCQWARALGATVIGTVGSEDKARLAAANGCEHPLISSRENVAARVREITGGAGVRVVYDSIGKDTFGTSLDCVARRGMLVLFGQSSGKVGPVDLQVLNAKGSLFVTRPTLFDYTASRAELVDSAACVFEMVKRGAVKIHVGQTYPLRDAGRAHADLEARRTTGSTVLVP